MDFIPIEAPERVGDWEGLHVRSLRQFSTYYLDFPKHTIFEIRRSGPKKSLISLPCKCCGIAGHIDIKSSKQDFLLDFQFVELVGHDGK